MSESIGGYNPVEHEKNIEVLAEEAYKILTARGMRRKTPDEETERDVKEAIVEQINQHEPIEIVTFWGGFKDTKSGEADLVDQKALKRVADQLEKLKQTGIEAEVVLLFSNHHAISPYYGRGLSYAEKSENYFEGIKAIAEELGLKIVQTCNARFGVSYETIKKAQMPDGEKVGLTYINDPKTKQRFIDLGKEIWLRLNEDEKQSVIDSARRHADPEVIQKEGVEDIALMYLGSRRDEKNWFEEVYRNGIFFSYGKPLPEINPKKTLYWYSTKRGVSQPPWFMSDRDQSA